MFHVKLWDSISFIKVDWSGKAADHKMRCQYIAKTYNHTHKQSKQTIVLLLAEPCITI